MRFYEIRSGVQIPLSNEENRLVETIREAGQISAEKLDERDTELARILTTKGVLNRTTNEDDVHSFTVNDLEKLWRD